MENITFRVWKEGHWFLSEVLGKEDELYAQGESYADSLSNLFSVISEIEKLNKEEKTSSMREFSGVFQHIPKEEVVFEVPAFS